MAGTKLASFPNSRIKPRPSTRVAVTDRVLVPSAGPISLLAADPNRTILTLFNEGPNDIFYQYSTSLNILVDGFRLIAGAATDLESPEEIFVQADGVDSTLSIDDGTG